MSRPKPKGRCHLCGKPIWGPVLVTADGDKVHPGCPGAYAPPSGKRTPAESLKEARG